MSLGLKERPTKDSLEVRALFAVHRAFGKDGKLWVKHYYSKRSGGEVYRNLVGGVHSISNQPLFDRAHMRDSMFRLLYSALPRHYRHAHVMSYAAACRDFNDRPNTTWPDVEAVIRGAIQIGRDRAEG